MKLVICNKADTKVCKHRLTCWHGQPHEADKACSPAASPNRCTVGSDIVASKCIPLTKRSIPRTS